MELHEKETLQEVNEHIRLIQRADGFTFGTDAYLLSAYVRPQPRAVAVDLGSGTGIIPLLCLSREKAARFVAVELQERFCSLIDRNAILNGMQGRLRALCADVRTITAASLGGEVDIVTANPPYMPLGSGARNETEEKAMARHETAGGIRDFCAAAARCLKHGGKFYCVFRAERLADLFEGLREAHLEPKRVTTVSATPLSAPSLILVEAVKGASPSLFITPNLSINESDPSAPEKPRLPLVQTADTDFIYRNCAFPPRFTLHNRKKS